MSNQILHMQRWQKQVQAGNECFNAHQLFTAVAHYQAAKQLAWQLFTHWEDPAEAVAVVIISYHNLADLYLRRMQLDMAGNELERVHSSLLKEISEEADSARYQALLSGIRRTYQALLEFCQKHRPEQLDALKSRHATELLAS
ncbi:hypothetical protein [Aliamphritea ceti]|uniref:hypothetical protein n=1 Tax=Aliamphritea ceti TaxID=1524258 RepID=UPI0021C34AD4|nr:hypothetical protein [Aliamphritea ceti]